MLTICLGEEPESLYPLLANSQASKAVLQAIFDGPVDFIDGKPYPVILTNLPNFSDGSAYITPKAVNSGDTVIDIFGDSVLLQAGVRVFPSGCTNSNCAIIWDGETPLEMEYLTSFYQLKPGLTWSDGHPLTANDSVYSFNVASDPATPVSKTLINHTSSYSAMDTMVIRWVSKPGLVTDDFEKYFWIPLPEHAWGRYSPSDLLTADEVNRSPVGWGAYKMEEWIEGKSIRLAKNPNYFRTKKGIPFFDYLVFKFIGPHGDAALSNLKFDRAPFQQFNYSLGTFEDEINENGCDLTTTSSDMRDQLPVLNTLLNYFQDSEINVIKSTQKEDELLIFNLREDHPESSTPLLDISVRKAISLCLNRDKAIKDLSFGLYDQPDFIQFGDNEEDFSNEISFPYDPTAGAAMLDQAGWKDTDNEGDTPREASDISGIPDGKELSFLYLVEDTEDNLKSAEIVKASLGECGIGINIKAVFPEFYWDISNENSIFHGKYNLAQLSWADPITNPCQLFSSKFIPAYENNFIGTNFGGYRNEEFDQACDQLEIMHLKTDKDNLLEKIESIIHEDIPITPLFGYSKLMIAQKYFCSGRLIANSKDELAKIEEFDILPGCQK